MPAGRQSGRSFYPDPKPLWRALAAFATIQISPGNFGNGSVTHHRPIRAISPSLRRLRTIERSLSAHGLSPHATYAPRHLRGPPRLHPRTLSKREGLREVPEDVMACRQALNLLAGFGCAMRRLARTERSVGHRLSPRRERTDLE